jgi:hypothetical protein
MLPRLTVSSQWQTATKRIVLCCGCVGLSFLAIVGFGLLQRIQAAENILPDRQVSAPPTKIQPKLVASYGKLPLSFEANQGQVLGPVKFLSHGRGYTIFLTNDEAVLALRKSQPGMSRLGKFGLPGRLEPFGSVDPRAGRWPSRAADWKSLWRSLIPDLSQVVPGPNAGEGGVAAGLESQPPQVVRMRLVGGNAKARLVGLDELPGRSNYFIGNDPKKWRTNVPSYARVKYEGVYPGVDVVYYGKQRQLEYDFVVAPGADPNQIKLSFAGADGMRVDADSGDLVLKMGEDEVRFQKPAVSQPAVAAVYDRSRRSLPGQAPSAATAELDGAFVLASNNEVGFRVAGYEPKRALVIDPVLSYSTYLGGSVYDAGTSIAVDAAGNAYVTGYTGSTTDFPITPNALQPSFGGGKWDAFVAKLNPAGSKLVYSTYLGGSGGDAGAGIAVDAAGKAYVTGYTGSTTDFPITPNALQPSFGGGKWDAFVAKLSPDGSALVYSTYLGGSDQDVGQDIAADAGGNAYVTGYTESTNFPLAYPWQATNYAAPNGTGFVAELDPDGGLVYSTYLGGSLGRSRLDVGYGIAVDSGGNAYVTGMTSSIGFPTTTGAYQTSYGGGIRGNAFVAKLNWSGSALSLVYSTYLGGQHLGGSAIDVGYGIAVNSAGNAYVTGFTMSTNFPIYKAYQATNKATLASAGNPTAFVASLNSTGSKLVYSTYLGGSTADEGLGIAVDAAGNAYVTGETWSTDFPTANPFQGTNNATPITQDTTAFVASLNSTGSKLVYSTYLGGSGSEYGDGIAVDRAGNAYVTGGTYSTDFPTVNPCQATNNAAPPNTTAFVAKISPSNAAGLGLSPQTLSFSAAVGSSSSQNLTLRSTGSEDLRLFGILALPPSFSAHTDPCSRTMSPGETCTITVTFRPRRVGVQHGFLLIFDNAYRSRETLFRMTGTGH